MDRLYHCVCTDGVSVPAVSGERGTYDVFTLMGKRLGSVTLGVRLLSLGVVLLPHLPDHSVARLGGGVRAAPDVDQGVGKDQGVRENQGVAQGGPELWQEADASPNLAAERVRSAVDVVLEQRWSG